MNRIPKPSLFSQVQAQVKEGNNQGYNNEIIPRFVELESLAGVYSTDPTGKSLEIVETPMKEGGSEPFLKAKTTNVLVLPKLGSSIKQSVKASKHRRRSDRRKLAESTSHPWAMISRRLLSAFSQM